MPLDDYPQDKVNEVMREADFVKDALLWAGEMELSFRDDGTERYRYTKDEPPTLEGWKDALRRYREVMAYEDWTSSTDSVSTRLLELALIQIHGQRR